MTSDRKFVGKSFSVTVEKSRVPVQEDVFEQELIDESRRRYKNNLNGIAAGTGSIRPTLRYHMVEQGSDEPLTYAGRTAIDVDQCAIKAFHKRNHLRTKGAVQYSEMISSQLCLDFAYKNNVNEVFLHLVEVCTADEYQTSLLEYDLATSTKNSSVLEAGVFNKRSTGNVKRPEFRWIEDLLRSNITAVNVVGCLEDHFKH